MIQKDFKVKVCWSSLDERSEDELEIKKEYEQSILGYIKTFNSLPPVGLNININCGDPGKIEELFFNGIDNSLYVWIKD